MSLIRGALPPPPLTRAPLCMWALQLPAPISHVAPLTGVCVGLSAWPPATRQRHLRLVRAIRALPRGLSVASHLAVVPCATSAAARHVTLQVSKIPFFPDFNKKNKNQIKNPEIPKMFRNSYFSKYNSF